MGIELPAQRGEGGPGAPSDRDRRPASARRSGAGPPRRRSRRRSRPAPPGAGRGCRARLRSRSPAGGAAPGRGSPGPGPSCPRMRQPDGLHGQSGLAQEARAGPGSAGRGGAPRSVAGGPAPVRTGRRRGVRPRPRAGGRSTRRRPPPRASWGSGDPGRPSDPTRQMSGTVSPALRRIVGQDDLDPAARETRERDAQPVRSRPRREGARPAPGPRRPAPAGGGIRPPSARSRAPSEPARVGRGPHAGPTRGRIDRQSPPRPIRGARRRPGVRPAEAATRTGPPGWAAAIRPRVESP